MKIKTISGVQIPRIIYGTAWKKEHTADWVEKALLAGFKGVDTAGQPKHYDEALVGVGLQRVLKQGLAREDLYLQTKFTPVSSQDPERVPYDKQAALALQVAQSFASSQRNLHSDYVDCLILHSPLASHHLTMQAWQAMENIYRSGGARLLGISNCYDLEVMQALYTDAEIKSAILQNRFYRDTGYDVELRKWCRQHGVIFQSFWSLTANKHVLDSTTLLSLAEHHHRTTAQIFYRFLIQAGIVPLIGTRSLQHMREDLAIFEFELTDAEFHQVSMLLIQIVTERQK